MSTLRERTRPGLGIIEPCLPSPAKAPPSLIRTARKGRYGHRDATLILVAYRHGLRAVELCDLEWSQVEFDRAATLHRKTTLANLHLLFQGM